jgi:outer membrane protein assembly factor BamB
MISPSAALSTWPQWRGPTHDGIATKEQLVDSFPKDGPPVLWVRDLGQGYSGMAVVGGRVYTQTQTLYEQQLICLAADSGKTLWTLNIGWPYDGGGLYPGPRSTPAVAGEHVFFVTPQEVVGCARASDGELLWKVDFQEKYVEDKKKPRGTEFGYSCSPLVVDGLVILPVGGENAGIIALKVNDGRLAWKVGKKPASYATPAPIEWRGEPLVVVLMQNSLACVHRRTGQLWWELDLSQGYDEHAAAPIYREPQLLIASPFQGGATCYELVADEKTGRCRPEVKWESLQLSNDVASSVLVGDTLYGFDLREAQSKLNRPSRGIFRALDWKTGETLWSAKGPGHAQLIAADGKLIGFNDRGEAVLFRASPGQYEELGRVEVFLKEVCWTSPALANGRLFLRTQSRIACLYLGRESLAPRTFPLTTTDIAARPRFDPTHLIGAERDYPATKPDDLEIARWYWFGLASIAVAGVFAGGLNWLLQRGTTEEISNLRFQISNWLPLTLFLLSVFLAGAVGSYVFHQWRTEYLFSWPLALWACYQVALTCSWRGSRAKFRSWERFSSYAVGCSFFAACALYFHLLRWLGLAIEWCFLTGFVLSFPVAVIGEWISQRAGRFAWSRRLAVALVSFTAFYWSSVWFMAWWLRSAP